MTAMNRLLPSLYRAHDMIHRLLQRIYHSLLFLCPQPRVQQKKSGEEMRNISSPFFLLIDFFLPGELGLLKMHASCMDGMDPALLVAVLPAQDGDRNPGIHEYRINEPVKINL